MQKGWIDSPRRHVNRSIVAGSEDDGGEDVARSSLLGTGLHAGIGDRGTTKVGPGRYKALLSLSTMKASFCLSSWIALLLLARLHAVHDNNPHCGGIGGERGDPCYVSPPDIATPPCCCGTGPIRIADAERLLVISSSSSSFLSLSVYTNLFVETSSVSVFDRCPATV